MHPAFQVVISPHYTAECLIYLSFAIMAAPGGAFVNRTLLCAFLFVYVNLSVSASTTKKWYADKFGKEKVARRGEMIPYQ